MHAACTYAYLLIHPAKAHCGHVLTDGVFMQTGKGRVQRIQKIATIHADPINAQSVASQVQGAQAAGQEQQQIGDQSVASTYVLGAEENQSKPQEEILLFGGLDASVLAAAASAEVKQKAEGASSAMKAQPDDPDALDVDTDSVDERAKDIDEDKDSSDSKAKDVDPDRDSADEREKEVDEDKDSSGDQDSAMDTDGEEVDGDGHAAKEADDMDYDDEKQDEYEDYDGSEKEKGQVRKDAWRCWACSPHSLVAHQSVVILC